MDFLANAAAGAVIPLVQRGIVPDFVTRFGIVSRV